MTLKPLDKEGVLCGLGSDKYEQIFLAIVQQHKPEFCPLK